MSTVLYAGVIGRAIAALVALVVTDVAATHEPHKLAIEARRRPWQSPQRVALGC